MVSDIVLSFEMPNKDIAEKWEKTGEKSEAEKGV